jgi:hypothetical protein
VSLRCRGCAACALTSAIPVNAARAEAPRWRLLICAELEARPCAVNGCKCAATAGDAEPRRNLHKLRQIYASSAYARFPMSRARGCFGIASGLFGMM